MRVLKKQDWFHSDGFPIVVARRDPQEPFGLHSHEFSEIVLVTGGKGVHITGEDSYELSKGDAFVIGGTRPHDYENMDNLSLINILFEPELLPLSMSDMHSIPGYHALFTLEPAWRTRHNFDSRLRLPPVDLFQAVRLVDQLEDELTSRGPGFGVLATTAFLQLAAYLSRCYGQSRNPQSRLLLRIADAISHIEQNYGEPIALDELVEISGMSRRNFIRSFEASMGCPPITYLIRLRIRKARELLQRDEVSITEIALSVGFSDSNYFSRQFRELTGTTPSAYRKRARELRDT